VLCRGYFTCPGSLWINTLWR